MKPAALALLLFASVSHAQAAAPHRGWLTGTGLGLVGAGVASATLGLGLLLTGNEANAVLAAYYPTPQSAPLPDEAPAVKRIEERRDGSYAAGFIALGVGAAALAGGVACLVLDGRPAPATVAIVPLPGGAAVSLALRW